MPAAPRPIVLILTPVGGKTKRHYNWNQQYAEAAARESLARSEVPILARYFSLFMGDGDVTEEATRILDVVSYVIVYNDRGIDAAMKAVIAEASRLGFNIQWRQLPGWEGGSAPTFKGSRKKKIATPVEPS